MPISAMANSVANPISAMANSVVSKLYEVSDLVRSSLISGSDPRVHHIILFTAILCQVDVIVRGLLRKNNQMWMRIVIDRKNNRVSRRMNLPGHDERRQSGVNVRIYSSR
jgi:hypothetical protein